ncbi:MAG: transaldolase [Trueperaceae bacterium]|nr:transaldolase [Trueperaceae bacterium]
MTLPRTTPTTPHPAPAAIAAHPLLALQRLGQSPWLDHIRRDLLTSGALDRMIAAGEITGLTSNPTIFEQAIAKSDVYDEALAELAARGLEAPAIFEALAIDDVRAAADAFLPVYRRTGGDDGYVSLEVAPDLAHDAVGTLDAARRLWRAVDRPNLMVKIPATAAGLTAVEAAIAEGMNVNVTLIFSIERHRQVMDAYLAGLRRRAAAGGALAHVASVASFFVSRVDVAVDALLDERLASGWHHSAALRALRGRAAIANATLAYEAFQRTFGHEDFKELAARGARPQRPLWASTSVKDPRYPDGYYVEALIGADTVDTMPPATLAAYREHGDPLPRLGRDVDGERAVIDGLQTAGIDLDAVLVRLEAAGVASFAASYASLLDVVAQRAAGVAGRP